MTSNEAFDKYLTELSPEERTAKVRDLKELCGLSRFVISDWRRGRTKIDAAWRDKITAIIGVDIFKNCKNL